MEKRDTRLAILAAAEEVFALKGYEKATIDEVASIANIAKGTVFYNFKSKEDIFFAIIEQGTTDFAERVASLSAKGKTAAEKLELAYTAAFDFFLKYHNFCTLLISELWRVRSRWNYEPTNLLDSYKRRLEEIFLEGQKNGEFRKDVDPKNIGLHVFFLAAVSSLSRSMTSEQDVEQRMFDQSRLIFLKGVRAD
ncbi:MAG: TetR/AcrR family transcriptional regulator [Anaerolineaceae bacterium]|nr:TetR/AcrR family transcriptional regulator [Anaerolineaceae bacterium]